MRICEITKSKSPQQQRVRQLKSQLDSAQRAAKLAAPKSLATPYHPVAGETKSSGLTEKKKPTVSPQWV